VQWLCKAAVSSPNQPRSLNEISVLLMANKDDCIQRMQKKEND
jgi:hypothetical protein